MSYIYILNERFIFGIAMNLKVEILSPSPVFSRYIEYYKLITGTIHGTYKVVPSCNQELYLILGGGDYWIKSPGIYEVKNPLIFMTGLHEVDQEIYSCVPEHTNIRTLVIVFKPNGIQKLFRLANSEIQKYAIDGSNVFKENKSIILEQLYDVSDANEMKFKLEKYLSAYINERPTDPLLQNMTGYIRQNNGILSVNDLSDKFYITPRTLQRRFKDEFGISPKNYLQLVRINAAVSKLSSGLYDSLAQLAYHSGYYDQSHFIKEIKRICGILPGVMEKEKTLLKCENINFTSTN